MPKMVDLALTEEEQEERNTSYAMPIGMAPKYPYGLSICLDHDTLEKLKVDYEDWEVGDIFHLHCFAKLTSISTNETADGEENCRAELQIVSMAAESEDEENEEAEEHEPTHKKMYKNK